MPRSGDLKAFQAHLADLDQGFLLQCRELELRAQTRMGGAQEGERVGLDSLVSKVLLPFLMQFDANLGKITPPVSQCLLVKKGVDLMFHITTPFNKDDAHSRKQVLFPFPSS